MSFGFSVGDILAGAELAYTLCAALSDAKGAASEYQQLGKELLVVHKVLLQVDQLRVANQLAQSTVNALLFSVNTTNEAIGIFLTEYETYQNSLGQDGPKNLVKDAFKKGKWALRMPDKVHDLRGKLAMMLAAINCLVSLSCYYNTDYNPQCSAKVKINMISPPEELGRWETNIHKPIHIEEFIYSKERDPALFPDLYGDREPESFFRPGQIFALEITSTLLFHDEHEVVNIDFSALPLAPIPELEATSETTELEGKAKRLAQIHNLPLQQMTLYCEELPQDPDQVVCLICKKKNPSDPFSCSRDHWASYHFRFDHWNYYFSMLPGLAKMFLSPWKKNDLVPFSKLAQPSPDSNFSAEAWISLDQIESDKPIKTDDGIARDLSYCSLPVNQGIKRGPSLIRRFVVVREGEDKCLCLGIHTFARHGCSDQPDQELFSILHSSKIPPDLMPDETGMVLSPIRMKAEHPSRALPRTTRIHYGRVYEISNKLPVQSIGLVQDASMETLLDQFEEIMNRKSEAQNTDEKVSLDTRYADKPEAGPADWTIVTSIRKEIMDMPSLKVPLRMDRVFAN